MNRSSRAKPAQHVVAIGRDRAGIGVVDDERLHRRIADARVGVSASPSRIMLIVRAGGDRGRAARSAARVERGTFADVESCTPPPASRQCAGERRQAGDRAHRHAAAAHALQAVVDADERRRRVVP